MLRLNTLAILGTGMMGGALARGLVHSGAMPASQIRLFDTDRTKAEALAADLGGSVIVAASARLAAEGGNIVLLAVKPPLIAEVLSEISSSLTPAQLVISIAAGIRLEKMESLVPQGIPIIRTMPNTPSLVGQGATAISGGTHVTADHLRLAETLFASVGLTVEVPERLLDAVTGLSGSGPAYVYLMIEALSDGGVKQGLTREAARLLAAQTFLGAAQMVLSTHQHPAQLKDNVTTPGGTTIAGLHVLEQAGIRGALMDAVEAAAVRARELS